MHKYNYKGYGENRLKNLWTIDQTDAETSTLQHTHLQETNFNASAAEYDRAIPTKRATADPRLRTPGTGIGSVCIKMLMMIMIIIIIIIYFINPLYH